MYKTNKIMEKYLKKFQKCGRDSFVGLATSVNKHLRCAFFPRICMLNLNFLVFIVPDISAFIRTDVLADIARLTQLLI